MMLHTMDTMRIYLNENHQGVITCMHCGQKRTINMSKYDQHHIGGKALKVKCSGCSKTFQVKFDFRRFHRISVNFPGKLILARTGEEMDTIHIVSLSVSGVGFLLEKDIELQLDEIYEVRFHLDDDCHSYICEEILLKRLHGRFVGAAFYHNEQYNYALDFYIMPEPQSV